MQWLDSNLGRVLNLSLRGARISTGRALLGERRMKLRTIHGEITIVARVTNCQRIGVWCYEIGLEFLEVDEPTSELLLRISSAHALGADSTAPGA